ncbi:hypothetical protein HYV91_00530 [Candidatus Wolfebacteria bacterium]|nr:hypothetical protein [Candidatus Wolfebacteria bacterium]
MPQVTVEKTSKYLILKIPIASFRVGKVAISNRAQNAIDGAIAEGLRDIESGRVFGPFKNVKELKKSLED